MSNMLDYLLHRTQMRKIARDDYAEQDANLSAEIARLRAHDEHNRAMAHKMYSGYIREIGRRDQELERLRGPSQNIPQKSLGGRVASGMNSVGKAMSRAATPVGKGVNRFVENAGKMGRDALKSTREAGRKGLDWLRGR